MGPQRSNRVHNGKGEKLQGVLYHRAGYVRGRKDPMIVYRYEKLSQNVHRYAELKQEIWRPSSVEAVRPTCASIEGSGNLGVQSWES